LKDFSTLGLSKEMVLNLNRMGYTKPTPIQEKSLPITLNGDDLIAKAKTGSGKTASFGIVVLNRLNIKKFRVQSLILSPTRELAHQVAKELRDIAKFAHNIKITTLCGGEPYKPQVRSLSHNAHIIVGTAGRVQKHLDDGNLRVNDIDTLVLDEADRMLDMGFYDDIMSIINTLPKNRQTLLFSATYPQNIQTLSNDIMNSPKIVEVESKPLDIEEIFIKSSSKVDVVVDRLNHLKPKSTIIFCNTKDESNILADALRDRGLELILLNSDLEQRDRVESLIMFANQTYPVMIATDIASRGLDIDSVDLVINYELPLQNEVYTHRIGRTARANKKGVSISFIDSFEDFEDLKTYLQKDLTFKKLDITTTQKSLIGFEYDTIFINGGKKSKLRAGDILGVLTSKIEISKDEVGKIDILPLSSYVAIKKDISKKALKGLNENRIKNRYFRAYYL
jgi:ATP-independent RNA helicase DbpA